jgi:FAD/FMN-containing dehydrogenase
MPGLVTSARKSDASLDVAVQYRAPIRIDWEAAQRELAPVRCETSLSALKRKSRDYYWFSPVLKPLLDKVVCDLVAMPRDEDELMKVARFCVENGVPLTPRGAGTGNYGQAVPLFGGVVVDLTQMAGVRWVKGGVVRAQAGARLYDVQTETLKHGFELRFHPSTWKAATIGGFVGGGSTGCGAVNYGTLADPGNVLGLRLLTLEDEPRFIELRGRDVAKAAHAYGVNGIITEVEMALAPAVAWCDVVLSAPSTMDAVRLADTIARAGGVMAKLLSPLAWSAARRLEPLRPYLVDGQAAVLAMVAEMSVETVAMLAEEAGAKVVYQLAPGQAPLGDMPPVYELSYNHTTLHAMKTAREEGEEITYLQMAIPGPDYLGRIESLERAFGDEVPIHLEFARTGGEVTCFGLQLVRYSTEARLNQIIQQCQDLGCVIFNPHTYMLEAGGRRVADPSQLSFKRQTDPHGLLNPGKVPGWPTPEAGFILRD